MAVTSVIEQWQGRGATTDEKGVRTLKRVWAVTTDSDLTWEPTVIDAVIAADPSAALYASHPAWAWALCREITASPNGGPRVWTVEASYSTGSFSSTASGDGSGTAGNPSSPSPTQNNQTQADQRPPTIGVSRKEVTKVLEFDAVDLGPDGNPKRVCNTVGDPFDPPPEVFRSHHVITWTFHRTPAQLAWSVRSQFHDSINDAAFTVLGRAYPARSLRCTAYDAETVWETGAAGLALYFKLTVQAEFNPDLWDVKVLNTGRRKYVSGSLFDPDNPPKVANIVDGNGQPVAEPVPLGAAGGPVGPGVPFHHVTFNGYVPKNWATILG